MKNKYFIAAIIATVALTTITACGNKANDQDYIDMSDGISVTSPSPDASTEPTASPDASTDPSQEPASSAKPTAKPNSSSKPDAKPADPTVKPTTAPTPAPTQAPTPAPTQAPQVGLQTIMDQMIGVLDPSSHNMTAMPADFAKDVYGIDPAKYEDVLIYGTMLNVKSNEIILIKAKDEAGVAQAKQDLTNRRNTVLKTWEHYLPDQYELAQQSQIVSSGNYVAFICSPDVNKVVSAFQQAAK